jgi:hypothetical protein
VALKPDASSWYWPKITVGNVTGLSPTQRVTETPFSTFSEIFLPMPSVLYRAGTLTVRSKSWIMSLNRTNGSHPPRSTYENEGVIW